jgi:hypothetical protein
MWKHGPGEGRPCKNLLEHGDKEGETDTEGVFDPDAPLHIVEGVAGVETPAGGGADHFGNLITDIPASALGGHRALVVRLAGCAIQGLLWTYADAPDTKTPVALLGSSGYLEVAINQGSAREVLHVEPGETVCVEPGGRGWPPAPDGL